MNMKTESYTLDKQKYDDRDSPALPLLLEPPLFHPQPCPPPDCAQSI